MKQNQMSLTLIHFSAFIYCITVGYGAMDDTPEFLSSKCENKEKGTANLELAIQLIKSTKDIYPTCPTAPKPLDCEDVLLSGQNKSGVYEVWPKSRVLSCPMAVYCDMETDGGGWTVLQRRGNFLRPKDYFFQDWESYKKGFGSLEEDFWLGNDKIFALTNQKQCSVRFDLKDIEGNRRFALYDMFWIDGEEQKYTLHINGFRGDAGDSMTTIHNGQKFTTKDQDNDNNSDGNCAISYKGGWWYNKCHVSNLNGLYHKGKHESFADGVNWHTWKGYHESLEETEIKIRSKDFTRLQQDLKSKHTC